MKTTLALITLACFLGHAAALAASGTAVSADGGSSAALNSAPAKAPAQAAAAPPVSTPNTPIFGLKRSNDFSAQQYSSYQKGNQVLSVGGLYTMNKYESIKALDDTRASKAEDAASDPSNTDKKHAADAAKTDELSALGTFCLQEISGVQKAEEAETCFARYTYTNAAYLESLKTDVITNENTEAGLRSDTKIPAPVAIDTISPPENKKPADAPYIPTTNELIQANDKNYADTIRNHSTLTKEYQELAVPTVSDQDFLKTDKTPVDPDHKEDGSLLTKVYDPKGKETLDERAYTTFKNEFNDERTHVNADLKGDLQSSSGKAGFKIISPYQMVGKIPAGASAQDFSNANPGANLGKQEAVQDYITYTKTRDEIVNDVNGDFKHMSESSVSPAGRGLASKKDPHRAHMANIKHSRNDSRSTLYSKSQEQIKPPANGSQDATFNLTPDSVDSFVEGQMLKKQ